MLCNGLVCNSLAYTHICPSLLSKQRCRLQEEAHLVLSCLALEHLLGAIGARILHQSREVPICPPAADKGLDVDLMEAGRVECNPARLLEVHVTKRRAQCRLCERHCAAGALCVTLCEPERDHEVEQLKELCGIEVIDLDTVPLTEISEI